jgi:hypothetical protein
MPAALKKRRPRPPNGTELLAAALLRILELEGIPIPRERAKAMTAGEIVAKFEADHYPVRVETARELGWSPEQVNHPTNLELRLEAAHAEKTAKVDAPEIAKGRKVIAANAQHRRAMGQRTYGQVFEEIFDEFVKPLPSSPRKRAWPKRKMQSRPFPKGHRPMRRAK